MSDLSIKMSKHKRLCAVLSMIWTAPKSPTSGMMSALLEQMSSGSQMRRSILWIINLKPSQAWENLPTAFMQVRQCASVSESQRKITYYEVTQCNHIFRCPWLKPAYNGIQVESLVIKWEPDWIAHSAHRVDCFVTFVNACVLWHFLHMPSRYYYWLFPR